MNVVTHDLVDIKRRAAVTRDAMAHRPGPDDAMDGIRFSLALRSAIAGLKAHRIDREFGIDEIARRSGLTETVIQQMESGTLRNPTWRQIGEYAHAIGYAVSIDLTPNDRHG